MTARADVHEWQADEADAFVPGLDEGALLDRLAAKGFMLRGRRGQLSLVNLADRPLPELWRLEIGRRRARLLEHLATRSWPLSFNQQRLWFLDRLQEGRSVNYNVPLASRLRGPLDVPALRRALARVVDRHAVLRTVFREEDGTPCQRVLPAVDLDLPVERVNEAELSERLRAESCRPFDLANEIGFRGRLFALAPDDHVLLINQHHIVNDGWSLILLQKELQALYAAAADGAGDGLAEPPLQVTEHALWQRCTAPVSFAASLDYWQQRLSGFTPLELPTDRARPPRQSGRGSIHRFALPSAAAQALRQTAADHEVTSYAAWLAVFAVLLSRYSGQDDLVLGTAMANRRDPGVAGMIGYVANTVPLRLDLSAAPSFSTALRRTMREVLDADAHQDAPFDLIVNRLGLPRQAGRSPIFQVAFVYQDFADGLVNLALPGLAWESWLVDTGTAKFDLTLTLLETRDGLAGEIEYATDLFEAASIGRLADQLVVLAERAAAEPARSIGALDVLPPAERATLLAFNPPAAIAHVEATILERIAAIAAAHADGLAVVDGGSVITYGELMRRADALADVIHTRCGLPGGERLPADTVIGVALSKSIDLVVAFLAVLRAGSAYLPLDAGLPEARLHFIAGDAAARMILADAAAAALFADRDIPVLRLDEISVTPTSSASPQVAPGPCDLAYVIYTSGTTGEPKGVTVQHAGLANLANAQRALFQLEPGDRVLNFAAAGFDVAVGEMATALTAGASLHLVPPRLMTDPEAIAAMLRDHRFALLQVPAAIAARLPQNEAMAPRTMVVGGEVCAPEVLAFWHRHCRLINAYGPTETTVTATVELIEPPIEPAVIGRPVANVRVLILDPADGLCPIGVPGEICIGGAGVARGYLGRPDLTRTRFIDDPHPTGPVREQLYRSGDRGRWRADGRIEWLGRLDDQVKLHGLRIEPAEIARVMERFAGVGAAHVVAREVDGQRRLIGYYTAPPELDPAALRRYLQQRLPSYMVPAFLVRLDALPLGATGKLDPAALPAPQADRPAGGEPAAAPSTPLEARLAAIWRHVLRVDDLGITDDFFALGGDSIMTIQVLARAREAGIRMTAQDMFEHSTIAGLAAALSDSARSVLAADAAWGDEAEPQPGGGPEVPVAVLDRLWGMGRLEAVYGLAPLQEGLLFHALYAPGSGQYCVQLWWRHIGWLDAKALRRAWAAVVERHGILRTAFVWEGVARPLQAVFAGVGPDWAELDWRGAGDVEARLAAFLAEDRARGFALDRPGPLRLRLIRLGEAAWAFVWSTHHILTDGWCLPLILDEVSQHYRRACGDASVSLPPPPPPFERYVAWLARQDRRVTEAFWRRHLAGIEAPTPLAINRRPLDVRRPIARLERCTRVLDAERTATLGAFARRHRLTLNTLIELAYATVLARYAGQDEVVLGITVAGRPPELPQVERMIGLFINTIPLRLTLAPERTVLETLHAVQAATRAVNDHATVGLATIQSWSAVSPGTPLFHALFVFENYPLIAAPGITDLRIEEKTNFPLVVAVVPGDTLEIRLLYDADSFEAPAIGRLADHLVRAIDELVDKADAPLAKVELLSAAERQWLLVDWNDRWAPYRREASLHGLVAEVAARHPLLTAVVHGDQRLDFATLGRRAEVLARRIVARLGAEPDDATAGTPIGLCIERNAEMVIAILAILKAGGAWVPLDPDYPSERLQFMIKEAGVGLVLTSATVLCSRPFLGEPPGGVVVVDDNDNDGAEEDGLPVAAAAGAEDLAYVIFTSGSTGQPKAVGCTHRAVINFCHEWQTRQPLAPGDGGTMTTNLSFDVSVYEIFTNLLFGAAVHLLDKDTILDAQRFARYLAEQRIHNCYLPPYLLEPVSRLIEQDGARYALKRVMVGVEPPLVRSMWRIKRAIPGVAVVNGYGTTETTIGSIAWYLTEEPGGEGHAPIGVPFQNQTAYLLDRRLRPVPVGAVGEICIGGDGVSAGYLNRPELSAERFLANPFRSPADVTAGRNQRIYRTGDLGRMLDDGNLECLGRLDFQIKIRGFRVEPGEIETAITACSGVSHAVAVCREVGATRHLFGYYVAAEGGPGNRQPEPETVRARLMARLPAHMVPNALVRLDQLPLSPNGKIDRNALPEPVLPSRDSGTAVLPADAVEAKLAAVWADVLGLDQVERDADFLALGGNSILAIQVIARARAIGLELTARQLFEAPTIAALACVLRQPWPPEASAPDRPAVPAPGPAPLAAIQKWFFAIGHDAPAHWNQALVFRLRSPVAPEEVAAALAVLARAHGVFAVRFEQDADGDWREHLGEPQFPLDDVDIGGAPEPGAAIAAVGTRLQERLDLTAGPLARAALVRGHPDGALRLLLAVHHLIIDGVSWRILADDLDRLLSGDRPAAASAPFSAWQAAVARYADAVAPAQADYWRTVGRTVPRLPQDRPGDDPGRVAESGRVAFALDAEMTQALLTRAGNAYRTQINDLLLTALALAMRAWCGAGSLLVDLEGHGREECVGPVDVSRTIGWFTSMFPVHLALPASDDIGAAIKVVKETLRGIPDKGIGYGALRHLAAEGCAAGLAEAPQAQVGFNYLGRFDGLSGEILELVDEPVGDAVAPGNRLIHALEISGFVAGGIQRFQIDFSRRLYDPATVVRLADAFGEALRRVVGHCLSPAAGGVTPSDFPLASGLTQPVLDRLWGMGRLEAVYGLAPLQEGLLFHALYAPGSGQYCVQLWWRHIGWLDAEALRRAWAAVVERHGILRTAFVWEGVARPLQAVFAGVGPDWAELDWRGAGDVEARLAAFLAEDRARGFALDRPGPLRLRLIRLGEAAWAFVWSTHHILTDGWCLPLILDEVSQHYRRACGDASVSLPPPPPPFERYVAWLARQDRRATEAFWRRHLAGIEAPTPLAINRRPLDVRRPITSLERCTRVLDAERTATLGAFARRHRLTLNTLIELAYATVLARYAGQDEVVLGITVAGRPPELPQVERMIGLFINTIPLRLTLAPERTVLETLHAVQAATRAVNDHATVGLATIQSWSAVPAGTPLFHQTLVFENYPAGSANALAPGLPNLDMKGDVKTNYPLALVVVPGDELLVQASFDGDCFAPALIERLLDHLHVAVLWLADRPESPLADASILTEAECGRLLAQLNYGQVAYPRDRSLADLFEAAAVRRGDGLAVAHQDDAVSFAVLDQQASRLAHRLVRCGVGPEKVVGVNLARSIPLIVGLMAVLKAGGAWLPLEPDVPDERLAFMLADSGAEVLITGSAGAFRFPDYRGIVIDIDDPSLADEPASNPIRRRAADPLAYITYTSGSTGQPKGVAVPESTLLNRFHWLWRTLPLGPDEVGSQISSINFVDAVWEVFSRLCCGAPLAIMSDAVVRDPALLVAELARHRVTRLEPVPSLLQSMMDAVPDVADRLPHLRYIICSGEVLPVELARRCRRLLPRVRLFNRYGSTEATSVLWHEVAEVPEHERAVPAGNPIQNTGVCLLDRRRRPVPDGIAGALYVFGSGLARGYHGRPDLTAERFVTLSLEGIRVRAYYTGDVARVRPDGGIEILGRDDDQLGIHGYRIEPAEIESRLALVDGIREAIAVVRDVAGSRRLVAFYVEDDVSDQPVTAGRLRQYLADHLPNYMVPALFVRLAALPATVNGKVNRKALIATDLATDTDVAASAQGDVPRDAIERKVHALWCETLGLDGFGIADDFFAVGGHSLLAVRLVTAINAVFARTLPVAWAFGVRTVERQAAALRDAEARIAFEPVVTLREGAGKRLFLVHPGRAGAEAYVPLAPLMPAGVAVSVLESWTLYGDGDPVTELPALAARYVETVRSVQADGPYVLGGWSLGGTLAYEMARQMTAAGQRVEILFLLDSFAPGPERAAWSADYEAAARAAFLDDPFHAALPATYRQRLDTVIRIETALLAAYRPDPYAGRTLLLKASAFEAPPGLSADDRARGFVAMLQACHAQPDNGWSPLAADLAVRPVPGSHGALMSGTALQHVALHLAKELEP